MHTFRSKWFVRPNERSLVFCERRISKNNSGPSMASITVGSVEERERPKKMSSDVQTRLMDAERYFRKACEQIVQLNRRLDEMAKRYDKASRENHRSFRYSLRLRMAVTEGVRNMYYEYAANKADEITDLRVQAMNDFEMGMSEEDNSDFDPMDEYGFEPNDDAEAETESSLDEQETLNSQSQSPSSSSNNSILNLKN